MAGLEKYVELLGLFLQQAGDSAHRRMPDRQHRSPPLSQGGLAGDHMGGEYQTDNFVSAFDADKMIGWRTAPAGTEPPGWEWLWELKPEG